MKGFLLKSWIGFDLIQMKWFRKWCGGEFTKVSIVRQPDITVWITGTPEPSMAKMVKAIEIEKY